MVDAETMAEEWRWGYLHGYSHGWADRGAGRQYGEGRYMKKPPDSVSESEDSDG